MDYEYNPESANTQSDGSYHYRAEQLDSWDGWQQPVPKKKPKKKKGWTAGRVIALALCVSLISGGMGAGGAIAFHMWQEQKDANLPTLQAPNTSTILEGIRERHRLLKMNSVGPLM